MLYKRINAELMRVCNIIQTGKEGQGESNSKLRWNLKHGFNYISEKV